MCPETVGMESHTPPQGAPTMPLEDNPVVSGFFRLEPLDIAAVEQMDVHPCEPDLEPGVQAGSHGAIALKHHAAEEDAASQSAATPISTEFRNAFSVSERSGLTSAYACIKCPPLDRWR